MSFLQQLYKHIIIEGVNILFRTILPSAAASVCLRLFGAQIGKEAHIYTPLQLHNTKFSNLTVGDQCHIGRDVFLDLSDRIEIGDQVTISMRSSLLTHIDVGRSPLKEIGFPEMSSPIRIGNGVYIGAGATLLHGVEIGENAVIAAGALVKENVPAGAVVVGVPGRVVKMVDG